MMNELRLKEREEVPDGTVLFEQFKKCLSCASYNPKQNKKCHSCGLLFYREATQEELDEFNKRYQEKVALVKEA